MIELPVKAVPNAGLPGLVDYGGFLRPPLGGRVQRIDRMGNRFKIGFAFPPLPSKDMGRIVVSRLIRGKTEGIRMEMPLLGFRPGGAGSPVVDGDGQAGRTLAISGFISYYAVREGQWFSHHQGDDICLYNVDAEVVADAAGDAEVSLSPMLRLEPEDGDTLNFAKPMIQGYVHGEEWRWQMALDHTLGIEFEIEEMV